MRASRRAEGEARERSATSGNASERNEAIGDGSARSTRQILCGEVLVAAAIAIALSVRPAAAQPAQSSTKDYTTHRVSKGDTLEVLAAEFYNDRTRIIFIMAANGMDHPRALKPGEKLRIPVSREYTTSPGDTFESLAETFMGDRRRGSFLAEFNRMAGDDSLPGGTVLSIPFAVPHTAKGSESLANIATAYYGSGHAKEADLIRNYNFLDKTSLESGERLLVPIYAVRIPTSKMPPSDPDSRARSERKRLAKDNANRALPEARQAWRAGEYARVEGALAEVEPDLDYLDTAQAVEIGVMLGVTHVAFDRPKQAAEAFRRVLQRKASHKLGGYRYSPKVLQAWMSAGGTVDDAP
ncbi:MAG: LysM peptidoglycan-binding domain-containing protein [Kofleriaceae bacterium]